MAFNSATVGNLFSLNWYGDQPPITRTHWSFGVRFACLRIGFVGNAAFAGKLAADVSSFRLAYPKVELELTELSPLRQVDAVVSGHLDAGYTSDFQYTHERELAVDRIAAWPWILAMRSNHPLAGRAAVSAKALHGEAFVIGNRPYRTTN